MTGAYDHSQHDTTTMRAPLNQARRVALPFSRVHLTLPISSSDAAEDAVTKIQQLVIPWLQNKADRRLPKEAWDGCTFTMQDLGAQPTEAVAFEQTWAARNDDSKNTDGRTFVTEIITRADDEAIQFGVNVTLVEPPVSPPIIRTVPRFVRRVAVDNGFLIDGKPVHTAPWIVSDDDDVWHLVNLLVDESRQHPVCAISLPEESTDLGDALLDAGGIQNRVAGAAHVVVVTGPASTILTSMLGERLSVFRGAVRTYEPGLDPSDWSPSRHRLALARSIENWDGGTMNFGDFLVDSLLKLTAYKPRTPDDLPSYLDVKQELQDKTLVLNDASSTLQNRYERILAANETLRQRLSEQEEVYGPVYTEAIRDKEEARQEVWMLRARVEQLDAALSSGQTVENDVPMPNDFVALAGWSADHLAGRGVFLHKRAIDAAKDSPFEDIALAYQALLLLRDYYVPMKRTNDTDYRQKYDKEREKLLLEDGPAASHASAGQFGDEYYVRYDGRKLLLNRHLRKGSAHDPKRTFALYYHWDDESQQVIVGSLPNHLTTAKS